MNPSIGYNDSPCTLSSLDLFDNYPRQDEIVSGLWEKISPKNSIEQPTIEFEVDANKSVIDLQNCYLYTKACIKNSDGTNLAEGKEVSLINYPGCTLYTQIDLYLNNDHMISATDYAYRSYMEALLSYNDDAKSSWLQSALWFKDKHGEHNTLGDANNGYKHRKGHFATSRQVELISKIHCEMFNQPRLLIDHVPLKLILTKNKDSFALLTADTENVKIVIDEVSLIVRKNIIADHKLNEITTTLMKQDAKYFFPHVKINAFTKPANQHNINIPNLYSSSSELPVRIVIGLVSNAAYNGQKSLNPFKFHHYNMTLANIIVNSKSILAKPLEINIGRRQFLSAYWGLQNALGYVYKNDSCSITKSEYDNGYFLLTFDLTATLCNGTYMDPVETGIVDIELKFGAALPETVTVVVYSQYENMITINNARKAVGNFK